MNKHNNKKCSQYNFRKGLFMPILLHADIIDRSFKCAKYQSVNIFKNISKRLRSFKPENKLNEASFSFVGYSSMELPFVDILCDKEEKYV